MFIVVYIFISRLEDYYEDSNNLPVAVGGLSITGVMADFSMYIFHPYGGKKSCKLIIVKFVLFHKITFK